MGYGFIDKEFAEIICPVLEIELHCLMKPKQILRFDNKVTKPITYIIYLILTIGTHTETFALLLIKNLENHCMILGQPWVKNHGDIIDIGNDFLAFLPSYYIYKRAISHKIRSQSRLFTKIVAIGVEKDITSRKMFKKSSIENMTDFL